MVNKKSSILPGVILIAIGALLMTHRVVGFRLDWIRIYPILMIILGISLCIDTFRRRNCTSLFWGTVLIVVGAFFLLRNYHVLPFYFSDEYWPVFMIAGGLGFFARFVYDPAKWGFLIPAGFFLLVGVRSGLITFDLSMRGFEEWIDTYWPVLIILLGLIVLFRKRPVPPKTESPPIQD
jgi:uncharacterized membrane protein HdeD (DUF308 family)